MHSDEPAGAETPPALSTNVALYIPNLMNYARLCLVLLMLFQLSKRKQPLLAFLFSWLSGLVDSFDGDTARHLNQTSRLGFLLDVGMDRCTSLAQMFILASFYPNYAMLFFGIGFVELMKDLSGCYLNIYQFKQSLVIKLNTPQVSMDSFKSDFYNEIGLVKPNIPVIVDQPASTQPFNFILLGYHYIWYSSDLFYILLFFCYFVKETQMNECLSPNSKKKQSSVFFTDSLAAYVEAHFRKYSTLFINFKYLSRAIGLICLVGAVLKFVLNFHTLVSNYVQVVAIDNTFNEMISKL